MSVAGTGLADRRTGSDSRSVWLGVGRSAGSRLAVLAVSAVLGVVLTRIILDRYGRAAFAQYGLLVGIGSLLPFADLGMSAAVMNAVASTGDPRAEPVVRRVLVTALRVLLASAAVLGGIALVLTATGLWRVILGPGLLPGSGPVAAMTCLLLIAVGMPLGIGQRVLAGLGRNHLSIVVLGLQTPLVLGVVLLLAAVHIPAGAALAPLAYAATALLSAVLVLLAVRFLRPNLAQAVRDVPRWRRAPGAPVFHMAWPMLVQMLALPLAMQTDRIVLSHRASTAVLAQYNLASQMFNPIWAVISAGGITLWPVFARARARGEALSPMSMSWLFGAAAAVMAALVAAVSPWLAALASGDRIRLGPLLLASFLVLMCFQGLKYPLGMFMTDAAGLRFQALMVLLMLPVNLGLSWWLAGPFQAAGPVIGSVVGVGLFQFVGYAAYVRRRTATAAAAAAAVPGEQPS